MKGGGVDLNPNIMIRGGEEDFFTVTKLKKLFPGPGRSSEMSSWVSMTSLREGLKNTGQNGTNHEKFHVNPKAAESQQTKFNPRHRIISR